MSNTEGAEVAPKRRRRRWIVWLAVTVLVVLLVPALGFASAFIGSSSIEDGRVLGVARTVKRGYVVE